MSSPAALTIDPMAAFRLDGQVALVTGASSGLGERFARVLHAAGATVVVAARREDRLAALVGELPGALAVAADLSSADERRRLVAEVVERFGTVDVLVNNAGVGHVVAVEDEDVDTFRQTMEINVTAVWHLCKEVGVPMVAQRSGSIVNIASMLGFVGSTPVKQAHYVASKGAVVTLTKELALQWARKGVRVQRAVPRLVPERDDGGDGERRGQPALHHHQLADPADGGGGRARRTAAPAGQPRRLVHDRALTGGRRRLAGPLRRCAVRRTARAAPSVRAWGPSRWWS